MPTASSMDPRDGADAKSIPHSLEAEQGLLGAILFDNAAIEKLPDGFGPQHFYEPFHSRLFRSITSALRMGLAADAYSISEEFRADRAYKELGGVRYLADLVDRAPGAHMAASYAATILDLAVRRDIIRIASELIGSARERYVDDDGERLDARAIAEAAQRDITAIQMQTAREVATPLGDALASVMAHIDDASTPVGILTGLRPIDRQLGPLAPGDMILLGGRPSMGKSALALAAGLNVAAPDLADLMNGFEYDGRARAGVFQAHGEMSWGGRDGGQVARRHLSDVGYHFFGEQFPTYKQIRNRENIGTTQYQQMRDAIAHIGDAPIYGVKRSGLRISTLRTLVRRQASAWERQGIPLGLVTIDHAGLMRGDGRARGRYEEQSEISQGLKELADELGVPILVLLQLSRDIEKRDDKRPQLSDLRDSGRWEEDADAVLFVYRDSYYAKREKAPDMAKNQLAWDEWDRRCRSRDIEVILGKLREGDASSTKVWGDLPHNAIRGTEPGLGGIFAP